MSEKPSRGFVLAPAKFGSQGRGQDDERQGGTRPNFTGLKESKLGLLAESKLTPSSGAIQAVKAASLADNAPAATTFSFTPLTKPVSDENKPPTDLNEVEKCNSGEKVESKAPVFGENMSEKAVVVTDENKEAEKEKVESSDSEVGPGPVFGQNLADRVMNVKNGEAEQESKKVFSPSATSLLFSSAVSKTADEGEKKTLSESAAEYTESHESNKRKYEEVEVVTGEEEESNVLQATGKLYLFDSEKRNWTERGRGQFRLNDDPVSAPGHLKSRLVMRTVGSLRVILNTKLWADMIYEKADEKKVRISAFDEGEVKIFLIASSPKDAEKLFTALEYRISQLKLDREEEGGPPPEKKAQASSD